MFFRVASKIREVETIAHGRQIRELKRLNRNYGSGKWRKRKGIARIQLTDGTINWQERSKNQTPFAKTQ